VSSAPRTVEPTAEPVAGQPELSVLMPCLTVRLRSSSAWPSASSAAFVVPVLRPLDRVPFPFSLSLWAVARRG
jgi:hypothetical protein